MKSWENQIIIKDFQWYYNNGYITSRDGNACYVSGDGFVVTASGAKKNDMEEDDFIFVSSDGISARSDKKVSIETGAHIAALKSSGKKASVHVHSPNTVALAALFEEKSERRFGPNTTNLVDMLNSNWPELFRHTRVGSVVRFLDPGSKMLHGSIEASLGYWEDEIIGTEDADNLELINVKKFNDIVIMQRHGVLATGNNVDECMEHIVRTEHVCSILLKIVTASGGKLEAIL